MRSRGWRDRRWWSDLEEDGAISARFRRHKLGPVILKARPWHNREGGVILVRSWRDRDDEIEGDDLTQRRMVHLGLRRWAELNGTSLISVSPVSLRALFVSLSLVSKSGNGLKVKYKRKMIYGSKLNILRLTEKIFWKIYISCATKYPHLRKSISRSDLKPKQTQP